MHAETIACDIATGNSNVNSHDYGSENGSENDMCFEAKGESVYVYEGRTCPSDMHSSYSADVDLEVDPHTHTHTEIHTHTNTYAYSDAGEQAMLIGQSSSEYSDVCLEDVKYAHTDKHTHTYIPIHIQSDTFVHTSKEAIHKTCVKVSSALGLALMGLSAFVFCCATVCVKIATRQIHVIQVVFIRSLIQSTLGLSVCAVKKQNPFGGQGFRLLLVGRGVFGTLSSVLFFLSITQLPLGDASAIFFTNPFICAVLARIFLGESYAYYNAICALVSFVGVCLIAQPTFLFGEAHTHTHTHTQTHTHTRALFDDMIAHADSLTPLDTATGVYMSRSQASLVCLCGAAGCAIGLLLVRRLSVSQPSAVLISYFGVVSLCFSVVAMYFIAPMDIHTLRHMSTHTWAAAVGVGGCTFVGQTIMNQGLKLEKAGPATAMRNLDVVFAYLFQVLLLHDATSALSIIGAALILTASATMAILKCTCTPVPVAPT